MLVSDALLVFAHQDEAQAFSDVPHLVTGIGKINAVVALSERLAQGKVEQVVVLGTAGMLDDALDIETVYRVNAAIQHDFEFPSDTALLSADASVTMADPLSWAALLHERASSTQSFNGNGIPEAVIATGDVFVKDDTLRHALTAQGAHLVDMESYAYAVLCRVFQIPIRIFKIPSDFADSATSHETWDEIVARKSQQLLQFAQKHSLL